MGGLFELCVGGANIIRFLGNLSCYLVILLSCYLIIKESCNL